MMTSKSFNIDSLGKAEALVRALFLAQRRYDETGTPQSIWDSGWTYMYRDRGDVPMDWEYADEGYAWEKFLEVPSEDGCN